MSWIIFISIVILIFILIFFKYSYFKDVFSGKIGKQNVLLGRNIDKLINKVNNLSDHELLKHWIISSVTISYIFLNDLLFESEEIEKKEDGSILYVNEFKKYISYLTEEKVFELFKLLAGYYLADFITNPDIDKVMDLTKSTKEKLVQEVFEIYNFSEADIGSYNEHYYDYGDQENFHYTGLFFWLHNEMLNIYNISAEEKRNTSDLLTSHVVYIRVLEACCERFHQILNEKLLFYYK